MRTLVPCLICALFGCTGAVAQGAPAPAKPLGLLAPVSPDDGHSPSVAEGGTSRSQRRAECRAQAEKLYASQKKQFMKECMASKG